MVTYGTYRDLRGDRAALGEIVAYGFKLLAPIFVLGIVVTIIYFLGFVLLVVPGVIAIVFLWVAIPAAVIERTGIFASIRRSRQLTKGSRWRVFGILVLMVVVFVVGIGIAAGIATWFAGSTNVTDASFHAWSTQLGAFVGAVLGLFFSVLVAVSYFLLRSQHEGVGVADLAAVFD
jgi:hypothetical protein